MLSLKALHFLQAAFAVSLGASIGAIARWQLGVLLNHPGAWLPWGTLAANLIGGYVIGVLVGIFLIVPNINPIWRLLLVTGLMGGLTTFSSFSSEVIEMMVQGRLGTAAATVALHVCGSFVLTYFGLRNARTILGMLHG
jgi:CrcB protein